MASCDEAIVNVLSWEDPRLTGKITVDSGGRTRFGIAERAHPELSATLFYSSLGSEAALVIAKGIYQKQYCDPLCIALMSDQPIANKVLNLGVNVGIIPAAKMLRDALCVVGDGRIGPLTLHALDIADKAKALDALRQEAVDYYNHLIANNPALAIYRNGWLRRAEA